MSDGPRYGLLTVLGEARKVYRSCTVAGLLVRCDCGVEKIVGRYEVTSGQRVSCGCLIKSKHKAFCDAWKERKRG